MDLMQQISEKLKLNANDILEVYFKCHEDKDASIDSFHSALCRIRTKNGVVMGTSLLLAKPLSERFTMGSSSPMKAEHGYDNSTPTTWGNASAMVYGGDSFILQHPTERRELFSGDNVEGASFFASHSHTKLPKRKKFNK